MSAAADDEIERKNAKPRISTQEAEALIRILVGIPSTTDVTLGQLDSYDDQNFKVDIQSTPPVRYVLKIHNGVESLPGKIKLLHAQNSILLHLASGGGSVSFPRPLALPSLVDSKFVSHSQADEISAAYGDVHDDAFASSDKISPDGDGSLRIVRLPSCDGEQRFHAVRVLEYVEGELLASKVDGGSEKYLALLGKVGTTIANMNKAIEEWKVHPGVVRSHLWDLASLSSLTGFLDHIADADKRAIADRVYADFAENVVPAMDSLPDAAIHNDANDQNILVDAEGNDVVGIIDFGDMVWTKRIFELAILTAYSILPSVALLDDPDHDDSAELSRLLAAARAVISGYTSVFSTLSSLELSLLHTLIRARLAQSVTMSAYSHSKDPTNDYLLVTARPGWNTLRLLETIDSTHFYDTVVAL